MRRHGRLPSELSTAVRGRTRPDPFIDVWGDVQKLFEDNAGLEAKTVFEFLQRQNPGRFQDGQVRTLQRRVNPSPLSSPSKGSSTRCGVSDSRLLCQAVRLPWGVGVDQEDRAIPGTFSFDGEMFGQHGFGAAALLRVDDDRLHVFMSTCWQYTRC
jgi:hypothetical protein